MASAGSEAAFISGSDGKVAANTFQSWQDNNAAIYKGIINVRRWMNWTSS